VVNVSIGFKIKNIDLAVARVIVQRQFGNILQENMKDFRPLIEDSIDDEIEKNKNRFIPNSVEAAQLGVGEGGEIAYEKTETAWEALQIKSGEGVTTFNIEKTGSGAGRTFANIYVDIGEHRFFKRPRSIIDTPDSEKIDKIPWMEWFIEGKEIGGVRFSRKTPVPETSRTGRGIMIEGGLWSFTPRSVMLIEQLIEKIRLRIGRDFRDKAAVILRR